MKKIARRSTRNPNNRKGVTMNRIDEIVTGMIDKICSAGRGFVLGLMPDDDKSKRIEVTVSEQLPPVDDYEPPAAYAAHGVNDARSLVAFAKRYGKAKDSLILYDQERVSLTLDETISHGQRQVITMKFVDSPDWQTWSAVLGKPLAHRDLLRFLLSQEHLLLDMAIIEPLRTLKLKSEVKHDSDIQIESQSIGVVFTTNGQEEIKKFQTKIPISLPVLEQDVSQRDRWMDFTIRVDFELPDRAHEGPTFTLRCSEWQMERMSRIHTEGETIAEQLGEGWLVLHGLHGTAARPVGIRDFTDFHDG